MSYKRSRRVANLLREEISRIIQFKLKDPWVGFVTVTSVKVADDLRSAKVYVSVMGDQETKDSSLAGLARAARFIEHELLGRTDLKYAPHLTFYCDNTLDYVESIDKLLKEIHKH